MVSYKLATVSVTLKLIYRGYINQLAIGSEYGHKIREKKWFVEECERQLGL